MLDRELELEELYAMKHKHDANPEAGHAYERDLLERAVTPVLYKNPELGFGLLPRLQELLVVMVDGTQFLRNLFNYNVRKYYDGHGR